jgi:lipopolysaccharide transport system permease protein
MFKRSLLIAVADIAAAINRYSLVGMLGWQDVLQRYRRSTLGPFWLTISMGVLIGTIGVVFSQLFEAPVEEFIPFLALGIILWNFILSVLTEGCTGFISAEAVIKQLPIPLFVHILRLFWRNIIIFGHNFVIFPVVLMVVGKPLSWLALLSIIGFMLLLFNLVWVALVLAVFCARYRDMPQIVASVLQVFFYLTPIIWMPSILPERASLYLLEFNPFYHLLEIVRAPLLGYEPSYLNWVVSLVLGLIGWISAIVFYGTYKRRIAYWL